jgi:hypothetical protein
MLTPAQQSTLDYHLRETNLLTNEELILELTDHYTTALSERIAQGMTFETALTDTQHAFGGRKGLQKMERQYNRVTFRRYDSLFMGYVQQQSRWPRVLLSVLIYALAYWTMTHTDRPTSFSLSMFTNTVWGGFALGTTGGLILQFLRLVFQQGIVGRNISPKALYLITRFLPINLFQYGFIAAMINWAHLFPPYVYEAALSACAPMAITYMLSYGQFYQAVFKRTKSI